MLEFFLPSRLPRRFQDKLHRSPFDSAVPASIQQVNDHRDGYGEQGEQNDGCFKIQGKSKLLFSFRETVYEEISNKLFDV